MLMRSFTSLKHLPEAGVTQNRAGAEKRGIDPQWVACRGAAGIEHAAVFGIADDTRLHQDAQHIAAADRNVGAILAVFTHLRKIVYQLDGKRDLRDAGSGVPVVQADVKD